MVNLFVGLMALLQRVYSRVLWYRAEIHEHAVTKWCRMVNLEWPMALSLPRFTFAALYSR